MASWGLLCGSTGILGLFLYLYEERQVVILTRITMYMNVWITIIWTLSQYLFFPLMSMEHTECEDMNVRRTFMCVLLIFFHWCFIVFSVQARNLYCWFLRNMTSAEKIRVCVKHMLTPSMNKNKGLGLRHWYVPAPSEVLIFLPFLAFCLLSWKVLVQELLACKYLGKELEIPFLCFISISATL